MQIQLEFGFFRSVDVKLHLISFAFENISFIQNRFSGCLTK